MSSYQKWTLRQKVKNLTLSCKGVSEKIKGFLLEKYNELFKKFLY